MIGQKKRRPFATARPKNKWADSQSLSRRKVAPYQFGQSAKEKFEMPQLSCRRQLWASGATGPTPAASREEGEAD
jgi:hypothetical protein